MSFEAGTGRNRRLVATTVVAFWASCAWVAGARAQSSPAPSPEPSPTPVPQLHEEIVVTATRGERSLESLPVSVSVIDENEVESAPVLTTSEMLRVVPSLNVPVGRADLQHPTGNSVSMRGLGGQRVLFLVDGVPLNDPFFGFIQWEKVPPETMERVEIVRGASSSLFGSYALGGAVNILTKRVSGDEAGFEAGYGNLSTTRLNGYGALQRGAAGLSGNLNYFDTDGYVKLTEEARGAADIATAAHSLNAQARFQYRPDDDRSAFVRANYFGNEQNLETRSSSNERQIFDLAAGGRWRVGTSSSLSGSAFFEDNNFDTTNPDFVAPPSRDEDYVSNVHETSTTDLGGSIQWSGALGAHLPHVTAGADLRRIAGQDAADLFAPSGEQIGFELGKGRQRFVGFFAEASLVPEARWEVLASARLENWRNHSAELVSGGATTFPPDRSETRFDPRLSVRFQLTRLSALRGAVYTGFRAPNLDNLYRGFTSSGFALIPNPEVGPETLTGGEIGGDLFGSRFHGQLNLFRSDVKNLIGSTIVAFSPVFTIRTVNIGKTRSQGIEALADFVLGQGKLHLGYTFTDATVLENPDDPTRVGQRTGYVSEHQAYIDFRYTASTRTVVSVRGRYQSDQVDEFAGGMVEAHTVFDASVSHPLPGGLSVFAVLENAFDAEYVANNFGGPQLGPPRTYYLGLRWQRASANP
jgi:outer membrane receptor protein involved in Fe transport